MQPMTDTEKVPVRDPAAEASKSESADTSVRKTPSTGKPSGKRRAPVCHGGVCHPSDFRELDKEI